MSVNCLSTVEKPQRVKVYVQPISILMAKIINDPDDYTWDPNLDLNFGFLGLRTRVGP